MGVFIGPSEAANAEAVKAELQAVLASEGFLRAPSLAQFLRYVCQKALNGEGEQIKEYNIAVEAFGRQPTFDQKEDAIVRVEAHRLRKRLKLYYESEGADHSIQIVIPPGQYAPVFTHGSPRNGNGIHTNGGSGKEEPAALTTEAEPALAAAEPGSAAVEAPVRRKGWLVPASVAGLALAAGLLAVALNRHGLARPEGAAASGAAAAGTKESRGAAPEDDGIRIACGLSSAKYVDALGNTWLGDRYFLGGRASFTPTETVVRTNDPALFQTRREGDFRYDIPLDPGVYELHLLFCERVFGAGNLAGGGETSRLFSVFANGTPILENLDVISDAEGNNTADEKVFKDIRPARDGFLHLQFSSFKELAFVNGIIVLPAVPGKMRPVRILAGAGSVRDSTGRLWSGDQYSRGGQTVARGTSMAGTSVPEVYRWERYGNFNYAIPLAPGRYKLTLYFGENWFGPITPGGGGEGSRLFDIFANGTALLRNFDIYKTAGGQNRAVEKIFRGLVPNAQGKLMVSFVPVRNYAVLNALEVEPED